MEAPRRPQGDPERHQEAPGDRQEASAPSWLLAKASALPLSCCVGSGTCVHTYVHMYTHRRHMQPHARKSAASHVCCRTWVLHTLCRDHSPSVLSGLQHLADGVRRAAGLARASRARTCTLAYVHTRGLLTGAYVCAWVHSTTCCRMRVLHAMPCMPSVLSGCRVSAPSRFVQQASTSPLPCHVWLGHMRAYACTHACAHSRHARPHARMLAASHMRVHVLQNVGAARAMPLTLCSVGPYPPWPPYRWCPPSRRSGARGPGTRARARPYMHTYMMLAG